MADDKIRLDIVVETKGGQKAVKKLRGTFDELDNKLKDLSTSSGGLNKGFAQLKQKLRVFKESTKDVKQLEASIRSLGRTRQTAFGRGGRTVTSGQGFITSISAKRTAPDPRSIRDTGNRLRSEVKLIDKIEKARFNRQRRGMLRQSRLNIRVRRRRARDIARLEQQQLREQEKRRILARKRAANIIGTTVQTLGFTGIALSTSLKNALEGINFTGLLTPVLGIIGTAIGNLFGQTIGSILGDIFKAGGDIGEALLNAIIGTLRIGFRAIGAFFETVFIGIITAAASAGLGVLVGIFVGAIRSIIEIFSGLLKEVLNIIKSLFRAIASIVSALSKTIIAVFKGLFKIITSIWKGLWQGIKSIVQTSVKVIVGSINFLVNQTVKGFSQFIKVQQKAAVTFGLVATVAGQSVAKFSKLALRLASNFGFAINDIQEAIFNVTSAGFRTAAKAGKLLEAASKLAIAGNANLSSSVKAIINTLNTFKISVDDVEVTL